MQHTSITNSNNKNQNTMLV